MHLNGSARDCNCQIEGVFDNGLFEALKTTPGLNSMDRAKQVPLARVSLFMPTGLSESASTFLSIRAIRCLENISIWYNIQTLGCMDSTPKKIILPEKLRTVREVTHP